MIREHRLIIERYIARALVLNTVLTMFMVAALVAGPVIRKTRAAPGLAPSAIKPIAKGIDAVEQT